MQENEYWSRHAANLYETLVAQKENETETQSGQEKKTLQTKISCSQSSQHLFPKDDIAAACGWATPRARVGITEITKRSPDSVLGDSDDGTSTVRPDSALDERKGCSNYENISGTEFNISIRRSIDLPSLNSTLDDASTEHYEEDLETRHSKLNEVDMDMILHRNARKREASSGSEVETQLSKRRSPERLVGIGARPNLKNDDPTDEDSCGDELMPDDWPLRASPRDDKSPPPRPRSRHESMASSPGPHPESEQDEDDEVPSDGPLSSFGPIHTIEIPLPRMRAWSTEVLDDFDMASAANEQKREDALHDEDMLSRDDEEILGYDDDSDEHVQAAIAASLSDS